MFTDHVWHIKYELQIVNSQSHIFLLQGPTSLFKLEVVSVYNHALAGDLCRGSGLLYAAPQQSEKSQDKSQDST